jgi:hypothetical protein
VSLDLTGEQAVLYSSFDRMFSSKMCGSKAIDFQCALPGSVCVAVRALDLSTSLQGFEQLFRRLLNAAAAEQGPAKQLLLLVDERSVDSGAGSGAAYYEGQLGQFLASLWAEEHGSGGAALSSAVTVKAVTVASYNPEALELVKQSVVESLVRGVAVAGELASSLPAKWGDLPETPSPALSPVSARPMPYSPHPTASAMYALFFAH